MQPADVFVVHAHCRVAEKQIEAMPIYINLWICKYPQLNRYKIVSLNCQRALILQVLRFAFQPITFQPLSDRRDASGHIGVTPF